MKINETIQILIYLSVKYPGGLEQFKIDGGSITVLPYPSNDVVICHPSLPYDIEQSFIKMIEENIGEKKPHPVLQKVPNFEGMGPEKRSYIREELVDKLKAVDPDICVSDTTNTLIITLNKIHNKIKANKIREILKDIYGLSLAAIIWNKESEFIHGESWKNPYSTTEPLNKDEIDQLKREIDELTGGL